MVREGEFKDAVSVQYMGVSLGNRKRLPSLKKFLKDLFPVKEEDKQPVTRREFADRLQAIHDRKIKKK